MNKKAFRGWIKHSDFIFLDIACLQLCFTVSYWLIVGLSNPYQSPVYRYQALVLFASQLAVIIFTSSYKNILRRKRYDEFVAVCKYMAEIVVVALVYLFAMKQSSAVSRLQFGTTSAFFVVLGFLLRHGNKKRIYRSLVNGDKKAVVLVTSERLAKEALTRLTAKDVWRDYFIKAIVLMDVEELTKTYDLGVQVLPLNQETSTRISHSWVDEVFILQSDLMHFPKQFMDELVQMGMTVSFSVEALSDERWPVTDMRSVGPYKVLVSSIRTITAGQAARKRALDIIGGLAGCAMTGIIFLFIAPLIYAKSPGPIFFKQDRVGLNGRRFKMYKFRSMYLDAEERKAALMAQNKIQSGLMFKMDDDPRIIGSEKKDKNGKPKGIGNFIRNTSLDEFPQFINVVKGDMSLVGTRPPTRDEWNEYDLGHRVRMSIKPGITGMWQVSGRSEITDFEEVVKLDKEYIENWSLALDIKILLKTVIVVFMRRGAE